MGWCDGLFSSMSSIAEASPELEALTCGCTRTSCVLLMHSFEMVSRALEELDPVGFSLMHNLSYFDVRYDLKSFMFLLHKNLTSS